MAFVNSLGHFPVLTSKTQGSPFIWLLLQPSLLKLTTSNQLYERIWNSQSLWFLNVHLSFRSSEVSTLNLSVHCNRTNAQYLFLIAGKAKARRTLPSAESVHFVCYLLLRPFVLYSRAIRFFSYEFHNKIYIGNSILHKGLTIQECRKVEPYWGESYRF